MLSLLNIIYFCSGVYELKLLPSQGFLIQIKNIKLKQLDDGTAFISLISIFRILHLFVRSHVYLRFSINESSL